jgi:hypothetical protein
MRGSIPKARLHLAQICSYNVGLKAKKNLKEALGWVTQLGRRS